MENRENFYYISFPLKTMTCGVLAITSSLVLAIQPMSPLNMATKATEAREDLAVLGRTLENKMLASRAIAATACWNFWINLKLSWRVTEVK